jgi:hypothetical protein
MVKMGGTTKDGKPMAILGISEMNVQKLKEGMPILVDLKDVNGVECKVSIIYGETEDAIAKDLLAQRTPADNLVRLVDRR